MLDEPAACPKCGETFYTEAMVVTHLYYQCLPTFWNNTVLSHYVTCWCQIDYPARRQWACEEFGQHLARHGGAAAHWLEHALVVQDG